MKINWKTEKRRVSDLRFFEGNPREATKKDVQDLDRSLERFNVAEPLVVNVGNEVIGGNFRLSRLRKMGVKEVDVRVPDRKLSREEAEELNLRLNKNQGRWDYDLLANFDKELLKNVGWTEGDICKIFNLDECDPEGLDRVRKLSDLRILNLYSSIGGNRRLWGDLKVTAVENNKDIADAYGRLYPKDKVVVGDAHEYLEKNFADFDFIWSSPPCPTHSRLRKAGKGRPKFPDMRLYEEILFLQGYHKGKWVVENVVSWYDPLLEPQRRGRHYYWANFEIPELDYPWGPSAGPMDKWDRMNMAVYASRFCFDEKDVPKAKGYSKSTILRDLIHPKEGEYILKCAYQKLWTEYQRKKGRK